MTRLEALRRLLATPDGLEAKRRVRVRWAKPDGRERLDRPTLRPLLLRWRKQG